MFGKILGKVRGEVDSGNKELISKISKMNLTDMRSFVNNQIPDLEICEDGLNEVMHRLASVDKKTTKRYIEIDDMDSKKKKGFELVLNILSHKNVTVVTIESVNKFLENSKDIIDKYDKENKQIYSSRFQDATELSIAEMNARADLKRKMGVIGK